MHDDAVGDAGPLEIGLRDPRAFGIDLHRDDAPAGAQRARHVDGGIAPERADLEHARRLAHAHNQFEETALQGGDVDGRQARRRIGRQRGVQRGVGRRQALLEIGVDLFPGRTHARAPP